MTGSWHNFARMPRVAGAMLLLTAGLSASAQYRPDRIVDAPPVAVPNPTITAMPNAPVPLDTEFTSTDGTKVKLADLFNRKKPVIITMVYFSCPSLCGLSQDAVANRVAAGLRSLKLGHDYDIVVVSIDPDDTPEQAAIKRANYLDRMNLPASQPGFHYLTGTEGNIKKLADAIGFGYRRNFEGDKYLHSAGIFVVTPYGRVSKTLVNLDYTSDELHAALLVAADGKIGSGVLETFALPCGAMRMNPLTGRYEHNPWFWAGTAGGLASIAFMAIFLGTLWRGEFKKKRAEAAAAAAPPAPTM